jgi:phage terminase Nu1 subunit (DNA packaging protein)
LDQLRQQMLATEVNGTQPQRAPAAPSLWVTISELARIKGVNKAWISRRVSRWEDEKLITTRSGAGGTKLVNRAEYDRLARETSDQVKEQAAATVREQITDPLAAIEAPAAGPGSNDRSFTQAQRERAIYEAELKKLDLAERRGLVVAIAKLTEALHRLADTIVQLIDRLPLRAAEIAAAVSKEGEAGARAVLKQIAFDLRSGIAGAFRQLEAEGLAEEACGPIDVEMAEEIAIPSPAMTS